MVIVLRYIDNHDHIIEHFLRILHVNDTCTTILNASIDAIFSTHGLSIAKVRGQGLDGASNMWSQFNGLKLLSGIKIHQPVMFIALLTNYS